ncbi:hypothetical protein GGI07_004063 [Coemansia sp. Benny D115]|nr:hypothetical protein GGI07_004063 [Coemansia sp. Benny D115]
MPRNTKNNAEKEGKVMIYKEEDQEYAYVTGTPGHCRYRAKTISDEEVLVFVRGKSRKIKLAIGNLVLVSFRLFETVREDKTRNVDFLHKYSDEDEAQLRKDGELPPVTDVQDDSGTNAGGAVDDVIEFMNGDSDSEDDGSPNRGTRNLNLNDLDIDDL